MLRNKSMSVLGIAAAAAIAFTACSERETEKPLPPSGARLDATSVSGISSGAYMAGQFQLAHGDRVIGAAIIAGGPWGCAESAFGSFMNINKAVNGCMLNIMAGLGVPDSPALAAKAKAAAAAGKISALETIQSDKIYLFTGTEDRLVKPPIVKAARDFYERIGVPTSNIALEEKLPAGHAFITDNEGASCGTTGEPYVNDCDYDQAGILLQHIYAKDIYGPLVPRLEKPRGDLIAFDQRPYTEGLGSHGLSGTGLIYIPEGCRLKRGCRVHIAFHGCAQNRATVGNVFANGSGFARWADTNNLIILFPQTATLPTNPQACWDWWGYTGDNFLSRDAKQITAVNRMLETLAR